MKYVNSERGERGAGSGEILYLIKVESAVSIETTVRQRTPNLEQGKIDRILSQAVYFNIDRLALLFDR
jgi:hypothetical protein